MRVKNLSQQSMGGVAFATPTGKFLSVECPAVRGVSPEYPNTDNPRGVIGMVRYMRRRAPSRRNSPSTKSAWMGSLGLHPHPALL